MSSQDIEYYRGRAAAERKRASQAPTEVVAATHEKLASMYEDLIDRWEQTAAVQDLAPPSPALRPVR